MPSPRLYVLQTALVVLMCSVSWAQSDSVPLGDVVRAPKPEKRAARIVTNDEFPSRPPEPAVEPAGESNLGTAASSAAADASKQPQGDAATELKQREQKSLRNIDRFQELLEANDEEVSAQAIRVMIERTKRELQDVRTQIAKLPKSAPAGQSDQPALSAQAKPTEPPPGK